MAEVRKIVCDMCGRDIADGYTLVPSGRRRIHGGTAVSGAYRFDLCNKCFETVKAVCAKNRKEAK